MNSYFRLLSLVILTALLGTIRSMPVLAGSSACALRAYAIDQGSDLLNVRKQPNSRSRILGTLAGNTDVRILKMEGSWMLIDPVAPSSQNVSFQGRGWVFASFLGLSTRGYGQKTVTVFRRANVNSRIAGRITSSTSVKLLGCQGDWALVEKNGTQGWLSPKDQCAAPFTTCS
jgi:uncharacterized protein YgiM (DUF1202 family)